MNAIADGSCSRHLIYLLEFLAAWEQRPKCLTPMTYQWCSAISEVVGRPRQREIFPGKDTDPRQRLLRSFRQAQQQQQQQQQWKPAQHDPGFLPTIERGFSQVGPGYGLVRMAVMPHHARRDPQYTTSDSYEGLLSTVLEIGFRLVSPDHYRLAFHLNHTPNHNWVFRTALSDYDDDNLADAASAWIASGNRTQPGLCAHYLTRRVERNSPFSPRLRSMCIRLIVRTWPGELGVESALEVVGLLNRLDADVDDLEDPDRWSRLLIKTIRSTTEPGGLSTHYWRLLGKLVSRRGDTTASDYVDLMYCGVEVMRSLEEVKDWERLELWMVILWLSGVAEFEREIWRVTLELLLRRPSALPSFQRLCDTRTSEWDRGAELRRIFDQARTEQPASELPPPYVLFVLSSTRIAF